jgi:hypothetical protein
MSKLAVALVDIYSMVLISAHLVNTDQMSALSS